MKQIYKILIWITVFSIALGFLESSVVVYLRAIMYPEGFNFPLAPFDPHLAITEVLREASTVIILLGASVIAGKTFSERLGWFIYCFAIWDIFYYIFLKLLINWPDSFMTWDILFLIPTTWVGPVISPVIVSLTMIVLALVIVHFTGKTNTRITAKEWTFFITGSVVLVVAFIWDYSRFILDHYSLDEILSLPDNQPLFDLGLQYIPKSFNWFMFIVGEITILTGIIVYFIRLKESSKLNK